MTLGCNDTEIRKSEFVAKTQFLYCKIPNSDVAQIDPKLRQPVFVNNI